MEQRYEHPLSWMALTRVIIMAVVVLLLWKMLDILPVLLVAFVLAAAFYPIAKKLQNKTKMPLILAIVLVLVIPLILLIIFAFSFIPSLARELPALFDNLSQIMSHAPFVPDVLKNFDLLAYMQTHLDYTNATVNVARTIFSSITTVVLTCFLLYDFERLLELFLYVIPAKEKTKVSELLHEVAIVTGKYIRGNVLISVICGILVFVGLTLLHVPFALPLAVFAAVLDLLPLVGQTIGAIPAVVVGFGVSPVTGVLVIIIHLLYQQLENAVISPVIYNKALNLYPAVSFLSVLIGGALFGVLGAFLALPVAASIPAVMHYQKNYKARHAPHVQA